MKKISARKEAKVVEFLKQGIAVRRITKATNLSAYCIFQIRERHNLCIDFDARGHRIGLSKLQLTDIRKAISASEQKIAKQFGVPRSWLAQFRRNWWGGDRRKKAAPAQKQLTVQQESEPPDFFKAAQQETMPPQEFVEKLFNFAPRQGVAITSGDIKRAAQICMKLRNEFGEPKDPAEYFRGLCDAIAARLGVASTESEWVH